MMPESTPFAAVLRAGLLAVLAFSAACTTTSGPAKGEATQGAAGAPRGESEALAAAEDSLREGDCRAASENYLAAARFSSDAGVSMRAAQLALGCQQLGAARAAVQRWRELQPYSGEAALAAAVVALKRYDMEEAREALTAWRESGSSGNQDPLGFAQGLQEEADVTLVYRLFGEVLVSEDPAPEVVLAQARLALAGQHMQVAMDAALRAAEIEPRMIEPQVIVLRALSVMGEHTAALAGARDLDPASLQGEDAYLVADLLLAADRAIDAENELTRLAGQPQLAAGAERRLIALALRQGRLEVAEGLIDGLLSSRGNAMLGVLFLSELAERRGDYTRAIQGYGLLADTPMAFTARSAAARLMVKQGATDEALALLDEYSSSDPAEELQVGLTRAHLQVEAGDLRGALVSLDALSQRFPEHPDIDYTRATVLESGGRTRQAVAEFERALKLRPEDPQLLNALGYTLADHNQRLADAEQLIRKALFVSPDNPAIQDSLGWVLYRRGSIAEALPVLERAWRNSVDAEIGAHFGEVLWKSGDQGQARYVWQQALAGEPDNKNLLATIKRLSGEDLESAALP